MAGHKLSEAQRQELDALREWLPPRIQGERYSWLDDAGRRRFDGQAILRLLGLIIDHGTPISRFERLAGLGERTLGRPVRKSTPPGDLACSATLRALGLLDVVTDSAVAVPTDIAPFRRLTIGLLATPDAEVEKQGLRARLDLLDKHLPLSERLLVEVREAVSANAPGDVQILIGILGCHLGPSDAPPDPEAQDRWESLAARAREQAAGIDGSWVLLYRRRCPANFEGLEPGRQDAAMDAWKAHRDWANGLLPTAPTDASPGDPPSALWIPFEADASAALCDRLLEDLRPIVTALLGSLPRVVAGGAVDGSKPGSEPPLEGPPYRGLRYYTDEQARIFKGREAEIGALLRLLKRPGVRFLTVDGASGSGKSSLVWAGLWPRLAAGKAIAGSDQWIRVRFTPGSDPFAGLAHALANHDQLKGCCFNPDELTRRLRAEAEAEGVVAEALAGRPPRAGLLLFIDQFEELFTLTHVPEPQASAAQTASPGEDDRTSGWLPFVDLVSRLVGRWQGDVRVVVTLRSDFRTYVGESSALTNLVNQAPYTVAPPTAGQRRRMVVEPAALAGLHLPADLVDAIVEDTGEQPGRLALMSHLLEQLCKPSEYLPPPLTMARYERLGRVPGVISRSADDVFGAFRDECGLDLDDGKQVLRRLFGLLVAVVAADREPTRRRVSASEMADAGARVNDLAERLKDARLLVSDEGMLEVAHEALLTRWDALEGWIKERKYAFALRDRLERDTADWVGRGCPSGRIPPPVLALEMGKALVEIRHPPSEAQAAFLDPYLRAPWLLSRDLAAWGQAPETERDGKLWGADRFLGFADTQDPDGQAGDDADDGAQRPSAVLLPEQTPEQRAFLCRSFERALDALGGNPRTRVRCGDALSRLGDPRFDPDHWFLPDDPTLGFREVPEGDFPMGTALGPEDEDHPNAQYFGFYKGIGQCQVSLPGFWIARWPVTVAQYRAYLMDAEIPVEQWQTQWRDAPGSRPVVTVNTKDATGYTRWLDERMRNAARERLESLDGSHPAHRFWRDVANGVLKAGLPSEAEWEKAARGTGGQMYPWGDQLDPALANHQATGLNRPSVVGCFPGGRGPYGCEDLAGNVWEWTRSLWGEREMQSDFPYPYDPTDAKREDPTATDARFRVLRGGSFADLRGDLRGAARARNGPDGRGMGSGFRVVWSPFL